MSDVTFGGKKSVSGGKMARRQRFADERHSLARREADERNEARDKLTDAQQLLVISKRPGASAKEKARLLNRMNGNKPVVSATEVADDTTSDSEVLSAKKKPYQRAKRS